MRKFEQPLNPEREMKRSFPTKEMKEKAKQQAEEGWKDVPLEEEHKDEEQEAA